MELALKQKSKRNHLSLIISYNLDYCQQFNASNANYNWEPDNDYNCLEYGLVVRFVIFIVCTDDMHISYLYDILTVAMLIKPATHI